MTYSCIRYTYTNKELNQQIDELDTPSIPIYSKKFISDEADSNVLRDCSNVNELKAQKRY